MSEAEFNMGYEEEEGFQFPFSSNDQNPTPLFMYNHLKHQNPTPISDLSTMSFFHGRYNPAFDLSSEAPVFVMKNSDQLKNLGETSSSAAAENSSVSIPSPETGVEQDSCITKGGDARAKVVCDEGGDLKPKKV